MKKLMLLPVLMILLLTNQSKSENLDSLYAVWKDPKQPNEMRVKAYTHYIYRGFYTNSEDSSLVMANELVVFSGQKKFPPALAYAQMIKSDLHFLKKDYSAALALATKALNIFEKHDDKEGMISCLSALASSYSVLGELALSMEYDLRALRIAEEIDLKESISHLLIHITFNFYDQGDYKRALAYNKESLEIAITLNQPLSVANSKRWMGRNYLALNDFDLSLKYFQEALAGYAENNSKAGVAWVKTNLGEYYEKLGDYETAMSQLKEAMAQFEATSYTGTGYAQCAKIIGRIYAAQGKHQKSLEYCKKSMDLLEVEGWLTEQLQACECVYNAYKALGKGTEALVYLEKRGELEKLLQKEEITKQLERMEFQKVMLADSLKKEEEKLRTQMTHEAELRKKNNARNLALGGGLFFLVLAGGFYSRWRYVKKSKAVIEKERDRSENLLLNILPEEIAQELKEKGRADARDFELVSILFTDFKGFTEQSAKLSAAALVHEINYCFEGFDGIMEKYGIEKIKTIGDAYMAAGGLPVPSDASVKNTVLAALDMQAFIASRKATNDALSQPAFDMRVGIHTGPVVAGIVGVKKFQYDIWGDTVNTAARMESAGEVGKVNISQATYELLKNETDLMFESRGKIEVKGKGEIEMLFVSLKK